ncbi:helix-turn-helix transcriptional regulator [Reichenbachiella sp. MALMAid0571]|uniref:AraC family transcriptional regulator n=1 Tax=Reichenbachiella sp. MALMAid0571 TaxID=3143939 RepID=UPI0032DFA621
MKPVIKPTKPHKHDGYHELIFLSKGFGTHTIDDSVFDVKPLMGFNLKQGHVHCWDFSEIPDGYVILFKEQFISKYPTVINNLFRIAEKFELPQNSSLFILLEEFYKEFKKRRKEEILGAYLNLIILKTLELTNSTKAVSPPIVTDFYKFKALLNEHFLNLRLTSDYADLMNMSVHRLNSICMSAAHTTATNIIKQRILVEAKNLITHTSSSVSEIAYALNFSDASNFIKFFKSLTTLTPTEYRSKLN